MTLGPGTELGHYTILRSLGSGGMADVFEAQDTMLDRHVALKVLPIEYCRNPQLVARFQKEVRAAAKLNHRNIVTVFEVGQQDQYHYFSMRLLTGGDLRKRIEQGLSPIEALAILRELADAFAHAHARGFVHRDVKPENVMFDEQGFPVLTDFGIAKALDANTHMTRTGMTMGTPRYLSPEQASGKPVDARADLYSLGVMFYEMLTGRPPYDAEESMAVIFKHVTEPVPVLPPEVLRYQPLLESLMAKDADKRIASAGDLIQAIDALSPRTGTGEIKQSQLRTAESPLLAGLLTPSPLRTPAPKTPAPKTPAPKTPAPKTPAPKAPPPPPPAPSGEVLVRPPTVAVPARKPTVAAPVVRAPAPAAAAPPADAAGAAPAAGRRGIWIAGGGLAAAALAGVAFLALRAPQPQPQSSPAPATAQVQETAPPETVARADPDRAAPPSTAAPAKPRDDAAAQTQRKAEEQARAERQAQEEARLRKQAEEEEAARRQAAEFKTKQQADAEAEARRRAQAEDAQRKAQAEEEARRRAEQEAAAQEAARKKAAEEEAQRRAQETAAASASAAPARLTVVNDCRRAVELVRVEPNGKAQPAGTLDPKTEKALDSYQSAKWQVFEKSRRRPLLKELTLTASQHRLLVCDTAAAEAQAEEEAKARARRPMGF